MNIEIEKKIRNFRKEWKIPLHGFKTIKKARKYFENPQEELLGLHKNIKFEEEEIIYKDGEKSFSLTRKIKSVKNIRIARQVGQFPIGSFLASLKQFIVENKIEETQMNQIYSYVLYGNYKHSKPIGKSVEISEIITRTDSGYVIDNQVCLKFGPNIFKKDIDSIFTSRILPIQKNLPGYSKKKTRKKRASKILSSQDHA